MLLGGTQSAAPAFTNDDKRINLFGPVREKPIAWLNHYSITEFIAKRELGLQNRHTKKIDLSHWAKWNFNTIENHTIKPMLPSTMDAYAELLKIEGVSGLVLPAEKMHNETFKALIKRKSVMLFLHVSLLIGNGAPNSKDAHTHLKRLAASTP
ncbi:MAG: hypothetical protein P8N75_12640 [Ascidiaceihabitans sp.]|nr:hypothetical protein [Paracoccaceae bacterium]MDG1104182.1 hypothetical protein [Ascidiaceihabitans sp.]